MSDYARNVKEQNVETQGRSQPTRGQRGSLLDSDAYAHSNEESTKDVVPRGRSQNPRVHCIRRCTSKDDVLNAKYQYGNWKEKAADFENESQRAAALWILPLGLVDDPLLVGDLLGRDGQATAAGVQRRSPGERVVVIHFDHCVRLSLLPSRGEWRSQDALRLSERFLQV